MSLSNVTQRLTAGEVAREPRSLGVVAWFDGYAQANGGRPMEHPRRFTPDDARAWRQGWDEGRAEATCHDAHGFAPCTDQAHGGAP